MLVSKSETSTSWSKDEGEADVQDPPRVLPPYSPLHNPPPFFLVLSSYLVKRHVLPHPPDAPSKLRGVAQHGQRVERVNQGQRHAGVPLARRPHRVAQLDQGVSVRARERPQLVVRERMGHVATVGVVEHLAHLLAQAHALGRRETGHAAARLKQQHTDHPVQRHCTAPPRDERRHACVSGRRCRGGDRSTRSVPQSLAARRVGVHPRAGPAAAG
eukprot:scaffold17411_cov113-Isochrysis_galbana.AAC.5